MYEKAKWKAKLVAIRALESKARDDSGVNRIRSKHRLKPGARRKFLPKAVREIMA